MERGYQKGTYNKKEVYQAKIKDEQTFEKLLELCVCIFF